MSDKRVSRNFLSSPNLINSKISDPCSQFVTEYEVKTTFQTLVLSSALKAVPFPPYFKSTATTPDLASFTSAVLSGGALQQKCATT